VKNPLMLPIGRALHYWAQNAAPAFVRHDAQPFSARIVFVHNDGDVTVRMADHYGAEHIANHVKVKEATGEERHGHGAEGFCTWPVVSK
jgi:hypothetical protein